jgi:hypothetical protein
MLFRKMYFLILIKKYRRNARGRNKFLVPREGRLQHRMIHFHSSSSANPSQSVRLPQFLAKMYSAFLVQAFLVIEVRWPIQTAKAPSFRRFGIP